MQKPHIVYEDSEMLVINKPSGMIVNRADTTRHEITLQDFLDMYFHREPYYSQSVYSGTIKSPEEIFKERSGIVHRLDKETSGVLLIAKTLHAFEKLQEQFKERKVHKRYLALAHGKLNPPEGEINVPIGRLEFNRKRFGVVVGGRDSRTKYTVRGYYQIPKTRETVSLVDMYPETGRTHQLRVHLKYLNRPIVSDELYAGRKIARNDRKLISRLFLHAQAITFIHPLTGKEMSFEAPLSEDLQEFLQNLLLLPLI